MRILGISYYAHDTSAALMEDGEVVAFAEEERFNRIKHAPEMFPVNAINFCLKYRGLDYRDIDLVVAENWCELGIETDHNYFLEREVQESITSYVLSRKRLFKDFCQQHHVRAYEWTQHYLTHLAAAYYGSGFNDALILDVEGRGERESTVIARGSNGRIEILDIVPLPTSLGHLYATGTEYLRFKPFNDEFKVMGLSTYGQPKYLELLMQQLEHYDSSFRLDDKWCLNNVVDKNSPFGDAFAEMFGSEVDREGYPINGFAEDIACSLQTFLEEIVIRYVSYWLGKTGCRNLVLAGGVALNSKMNGRLLREFSLDGMYVFPAANDAGSSIGAAMYHAAQNGDTVHPFRNIYLGPGYSNAEIEEALVSVNYSVTDDPARYCAEELEKGSVIGWFQGRMEGGPRALGNRSVIADPRNPEMKDIVNNRVKFREPWRPFAPSLLYEHYKKYLGAYAIESPFMTITFDLPMSVAKTIPAAVHVDDSARPQTVRKEDNPTYHRLISEFFRRTGVPAILNTSFNRRGEPIVNTPAQALDMFKKTGLDILCISNYVVHKC